MNSVANGKVTQHTPFKRVYIQSAAGDAGGAIGAAFAVWHKVGGNLGTKSVSKALSGDKVSDRFIMDHAFWGPQFSNTDIEVLLDKNSSELKENGCKAEYITNEEELCLRAAEAISNGKWWAGFKDVWNGDRERLVIAQSFATRAARI